MQDFPAVALTGPRQSDKTTLLMHLFVSSHAYVSLDVLDAKAVAVSEPRVYFWRTAAGAEVDIIVEHGGRCVPIEAKLSSTPRPRMASGIEAFVRDFPDSDKGFVVHTGDIILPLGEHALVLPMDLL